MSEQMISVAKWQVMRVVWAHPNTTSQFIISSLQEGFNWQAATIKTLLGRLRKKGYLKMEKIDTVYRYMPLITEESHLEKQLQVILQNMCSTKHVGLLRELLEMGSYSKKDLDSLLQIIKAKEELAPESLLCHCLPGQCTCGHHQKERNKP